MVENFDEFLIDHANNEKKASAVAISMMAHYPDKTVLLEKMADLALEEMSHFRQAVKLMVKRGVTPTGDEKDTYINQLIKQVRKGPEHYFLDRLLMAAVIEARGAERFALLAENLRETELRDFYANLARSEENHHLLFYDLAEQYFLAEKVEMRWQEWLTIEASIVDQLPIRARLH